MEKDVNSISGVGEERGAGIKLDDDLTVKGRFARFTSAFWSLALPAISARYIWESSNDLFKPSDKFFPNRGNYKAVPRFLASNLYALAMGGTMLTLIGIYSKRTFDDIKTLYSETVGYELGKPKEQVGLFDILKSKNTIVQTTLRDFARRTFTRALVASAYLFPWKAFNKNAPDKDTDNIGSKFGTGAMASYLFIDGFYRKKSFFEALQEMVDIKINHSDATKTNAIIEVGDILALSVLHKKAQDKSYLPKLDSQEWHNEELLAKQIADLMNQTYHNPLSHGTPKVEHADFTVGKLIYLMGNGFLDKFPDNTTYVEFANRTRSMAEVKDATQSIKNSAAKESPVYHDDTNERIQTGIKQIIAAGVPNSHAEATLNNSGAQAITR